MALEGLIETLVEDFTLEELKGYRRSLALHVLERSVEPVEITGVTREGRRTEGVVLTTFEQKQAALEAIRVAIYRKEHEGHDHPGRKSASYDFSHNILDP